MSQLFFRTINSALFFIVFFISTNSAWAVNDLELVSIDSPVAGSTFYTESPQITVTVKNNSGTTSSNDYRIVIFF